MKRFYRDDFYKRAETNRTLHRRDLRDMAWDYIAQVFGFQLIDETIVDALLFIVNPVAWKKEETSLASHDLFTIFHGVIYKYTHRNLARMIQEPILRLLLLKFLDESTFINFAKYDQTLSEHMDKYVKEARRLRNSISSEA